jgi:hypothetical protein
VRAKTSPATSAATDTEREELLASLAAEAAEEEDPSEHERYSTT